ncbi:MAG: hypothetical protein JW947_05225 [Sedimentisphaerales bacterium]|nr:hypothetical protein [Sedimentisphaerales bacterium]
MNNKMILIGIACLLSMAGFCNAQETQKGKLEADDDAMPVIKYLWYGVELLDIRRGIEGKISVDLSTTVQSKHMWHGFDLYNDHGVVLPAVGVTLGDTGFSGRFTKAYPLAGGLEKCVQSVYSACYTGTCFNDKSYATNYTVNYIYYGLPEVDDARSDLQEVGAIFSWPKLFGDSGLMPNYYFGKLWTSRSRSNMAGSGGFIHVFGMAYNHDAPDFWGDGKNQAFRFTGDITYNGGSGCGAADHEWSHIVFGVSTSLGNGKLILTPYVNYQISMDGSVNNENELWCGLNATYRF